MTHPIPDISVIICVYTESRWQELIAAVESVRRQQLKPKEIIVVVDHNPRLLERVTIEIPGVRVIENGQPVGLSGARNSGVAIVQGEVIAFLDEDAVASPAWLTRLSDRYEEPLVLGVGGSIEPVWFNGRPAWFPQEFYWVVGCTYRGMPGTTAPVRNLIGCNMSFRRQVFEAGHNFQNGIGRVGTRPAGCEETEFCIRAGRDWPGNVLLYEPEARVYHNVPASRVSWSYFHSRCYAEGLSKAQVSQLVGTRTGLAAEQKYTFLTLPQGVWRGVTDAVYRRDLMGLVRAGVIIAGLTFTVTGYIRGVVAARFDALKQKVMRRRLRDLASNALELQPARIVDIDLAQPLPVIPAGDKTTGRRYQRAVALVRLHSQPLGKVELRLAEHDLMPEACAQQLWTALGSRIRTYLQQHGLPELTGLGAAGLAGFAEVEEMLVGARPDDNLPLVSIVVATRDRPASLALTLSSLLSLDYPDYEIIVVDNAPNTYATEEFIRQTYGHLTQVRYVREDCPGLAMAHNRGLIEVKGEIVAFTDDDVLVDRFWLAKIVQAFEAAEGVACVTGLIFPRELESEAQLWFEQFGGFSKGFSRRIFDLAENRPASPVYPFAAGMFGSGANMAFKTSILRELGGFDPALGTGTASRGGDDLAAFFQVISNGYRLVYEPAAIAYHQHRRDYGGLRRQVYGYGVGLTAYLTSSLLGRPSLLFDFVRRIPHGLIYALSPRSPKNSQKLGNYPGELTRLERLGMLYGPVAYMRSRWQVHHLIRRQVNQADGRVMASMTRPVRLREN